MNNYKQQALNFLDKTKTTFEIKKSIPQKSPIWAKDGKHGLHYWVILKNDRGEYGFDFWGSIADKEKNIPPSAYNVLACLDTFFDYDDVDEFSKYFGYDKPSLAIATFNACQEQAKELKKLFSIEELEELAKIN